MKDRPRYAHERWAELLFGNLAGMPGWSDRQQGWFSVVVSGTALLLILSEQATIDRVTRTVKHVIAEARAGRLAASEAAHLVHPSELFSPEEDAAIQRNGRQYGWALQDFPANPGRRTA